MAPMSTAPAPSHRMTPSLYVAGAVVVLALILAGATLAGPPVLAFALAVAVIGLAWGWAGTLALPTPRGTVGTIMVGGLALVATVGIPDDSAWLSWAPAALAVAMIAAFAHQLLRRDGRPRVVQSVSAVVLALGLVACGVLLVPPSRSAEGVVLVLGALAAAAASALTDLVGRQRALGPWLSSLAMLAGGAASVAVALAMDAPWTTWLLLGVASGALSHAMRAVLSTQPTMAHARPRLMSAIASLLVVGVVPYLVALAFVPDAVPAL